MSSREPTIMTVLGPITPSEIGSTFMHEHVIVDNSFSGNNPLKKLDEEDVALWEMKDILRAGGGTLVDLTCRGLSPDPEALRRISQQSGLHIVASTGFYRYVVYPDYVSGAPVEELTAMMVTDCENGFGETGIRAGMLGEFASHDPKDLASLGHGQADPPTEEVERVFRAAAQAHCATGLPITTHCPAGIGAEWEINVFKEEGVNLSKVIIGHVGLIRPEFDHVLRILDTGVAIAIDGIGYGERDDMDFLDHDKALLVRNLVRTGYAEQITVSLDMTRQYHLKKYGGHGYAYLLDCFVPLLREVGLDDKAIDQIMVKNPVRLLAR